MPAPTAWQRPHRDCRIPDRPSRSVPPRCGNDWQEDGTAEGDVLNAIGRSLTEYGIRSMTSHSTAFFRSTLSTTRMLLTVFGNFASSARFRRCTSFAGCCSAADPSVAETSFVRDLQPTARRPKLSQGSLRLKRATRTREPRAACVPWRIRARQSRHTGLCGEYGRGAPGCDGTGGRWRSRGPRAARRIRPNSGC